MIAFPNNPHGHRNNLFYSYSLEEQIMQRDNGATMSMLSN